MKGTEVPFLFGWRKITSCGSVYFMTVFMLEWIDMKKIVQLFVKIGLFFLGLVVVVYVIGLPFGSLEKYGYHYQYVQPKLSTYQQEKPFSKEVLFVGDSLAWTGFNPKGYEKEFGIKNYNLSTTGQMTLDSYVMIREALKTQ